MESYQLIEFYINLETLEFTRSSSVTVRLSEEETKTLDTLKNTLGFATGSKVILYVLNRFPSLMIDLKKMNGTLSKV